MVPVRTVVGTYSNDEIWRLAKGQCYLCGRKIREKRFRHADGSLSWDHVVPKSKGGSGLWLNKMPTHKKCNNERGDNDLTQTQRLRYRYVVIGLIAERLAR